MEGVKGVWEKLQGAGGQVMKLDADTGAEGVEGVWRRAIDADTGVKVVGRRMGL